MYQTEIMETKRRKKNSGLRITVGVVFLVVVAIFLAYTALKRKMPKYEYYENQITGEILNHSEFMDFAKNLIQAYSDSTDGKSNVLFHLGRRISEDSVIATFKYDVRVGKNYIVRSDNSRSEKIDMKIEPQTFTTINGDMITIGGVQDKPTMINLWFISCPGCVAEMPALNDLQKKYADKMNFIAITFEGKKAVERFLFLRKFTFTHISDADLFIKSIGTKPYPESIFIDKQGYIKYVEGVISGKKGSAVHFEEIIEELIR
jgi:thiol-disulfide isomerase/thioredoxin